MQCNENFRPVSHGSVQCVVVPCGSSVMGCPGTLWRFSDVMTNGTGGLWMFSHRRVQWRVQCTLWMFSYVVANGIGGLWIFSHGRVQWRVQYGVSWYPMEVQSRDGPCSVMGVSSGKCSMGCPGTLWRFSQCSVMGVSSGKCRRDGQCSVMGVSSGKCSPGTLWRFSHVPSHLQCSVTCLVRFSHVPSHLWRFSHVPRHLWMFSHDGCPMAVQSWSLLWGVQSW